MDPQVVQNFKPVIDRLTQNMSEADYGTFYSYDELNDICGIDIKKNRSIIISTNKRLIRNHERCLENKRSLGYSILKPNEMGSIAGKYRKRSVRQLKKSVLITKAVPIDQLSFEEKRRLIEEQGKSSTLLIIAQTIEKSKRINGKPARIALPTQSQVVDMLFKEY